MLNCEKVFNFLIVVLILMLGLSVNGQQNSLSDFDIEFVQFHVEDTAYLTGTALMEGYLKNNGPNTYQGDVQLNILITDTITYPPDIANFDQQAPSKAITITGLNIAPDDSTYFQKDLYIDDQNFSAAAKHGTLIWPSMYPSGPDTSKDVDTSNQYHTDSIYVKDKKAGIADLDESKLIVYPNPVVDQLFVQFRESNLPAEGTLHLLNIQGSTVLERSLEKPASPFTVNVAGLPTGIYYLRVSTSDQQIQKKVHIIKD
jgi:hypothetical protein